MEDYSAHLQSFSWRGKKASKNISSFSPHPETPAAHLGDNQREGVKDSDQKGPRTVPSQPIQLELQQEAAQTMSLQLEMLLPPGHPRRRKHLAQHWGEGLVCPQQGSTCLQL